MYWNFFKSNVNVEAALEKNLGKAKNIENLKPLYANDSDFDKGYTFFVNTLNECKTDPRIMADIKKVDLDLIRANCSSIHASKKSKSKSITSLSVSKYPSMFFTWTSREDNVISEERVFVKKTRMVEHWTGLVNMYTNWTLQRLFLGTLAWRTKT